MGYNKTLNIGLVNTGYVNDYPTREELSKKSVKQLFVIAYHKRNLKKMLIDFLLSKHSDGL